jgi:hypothetical protein
LHELIWEASTSKAMVRSASPTEIHYRHKLTLQTSQTGDTSTNTI